MPGQVGDQGGQLPIRDVRAEPADLSGRPVQEPGPQLRRGQAEQRLVVLVRHGIDPVAQLTAAGPAERRLQPLAVLGLDHVQPAAVNCCSHWAMRTPGTTRSSDSGFRSTIHMTEPRPSVAGSATASQMLPSSSSASPISATNLLRGRGPKCASAYRRVAAANSGAAAPRPTEPVEKSGRSRYLVRLGYACSPPNARR